MNRFLRALTNRSADFLWGEFNSPIPTQPDPGDDNVNFIRSVMGLTRNDTDYFVVGALSTVAAFPDLVNWFGADSLTYDLAGYVRPPFSLQSGALVPDVSGLPSMNRLDQVWPARIGSKLIYISDVIGKWQCGDEFEFCSVRQLPDMTLMVQWPAASGITGNVSLSAAWADIGEVVILDEPMNYPHAAIMKVLAKAWDYTDEVVRRAGLSDAFYGAVTPDERVAAVLTSLAVLHRDAGMPHS